MGRGIGKVALLVTSVALTAAVHRRMPVDAAASRGDLFVPRPEVARATALGFEAVLADYYWLQAVQVVGRNRIVEKKAYLLGPLIDVVTTLDPWVDHPYRFAAVWLTDSEASVRLADALLRRGIDHHPGDWRDYFYLGFDRFFYLGENEQAAEVLEQAMELPDAPRYLPQLVARLRGAAGDLDTAESFLRALLLEAGDQDTRERYEKALGEIATERAARVLDEARKRYVERHGHDIRSVDDLAKGPAPVLAALPPEPNGGGWKLDPDTHQVVSDVLKHRYAPLIDAVNRKLIQEVRSRKPERGEGGGG